MPETAGQALPETAGQALPEATGQPFHTPTPGLPEFDYVKPASLAEASQFLARYAGEARPFMGGTDTFVRMRDGFWKDKYLVDVKSLDGMQAITFDPTSGLTIGAAVNMNRVIASPEVNEHYPVLVEAARTVASFQLRTRATIAGNICNASPAGDTIGACLVLEGALRVHDVDGLRQEPLSTLPETAGQALPETAGQALPETAGQALPETAGQAFFLGPGKTTLKPGDIVTAVLFPPPPEGYVARYIKLGRNTIGDLAIVGVTALGYPDSSAPSGYRFRLALASVAPVPLRPVQAEAILAEKPISEATITEAAQAAMDACTPIDDTRGSARYRKLMVRNLTRKAVEAVMNELRET